jgi:hypothetical protein
MESQEAITRLRARAKHHMFKHLLKEHPSTRGKMVIKKGGKK